MMGFFGKKKLRHQPESTLYTNQKSNQADGSAASSTQSAPSRQQQQQQLLRTLPYPSGKSVRFASAVSDDEGGFVTDSELEINRSSRYGSLRARPTFVSSQAPRSSFIDRTQIGRSLSYDHGRSQSYSERQQHIQPSRAPAVADGGALWTSNGASHYQNGGGGVRGGVFVDDDYASDSSTASSFSRGTRVRSSLPLLKHLNTRPTMGLVFLTYQNETKKTALPMEIKNLETIKALFLRCFPQQLTPDLLNSPKRRFYILDRSSNKFFLLVHLQEVRDGTMLKLVDSDALTPSTVRRSRSAHSSITNESQYYSEPEFDVESSYRRSGYPSSRQPIGRMSITKETNIDEPITSNWSQTIPTGHHGVAGLPPPPLSSQPAYLSTVSAYRDYPHMVHYPPLREAYSDWHLYQAGMLAGVMPGDHVTPSSSHMASSTHSLANTGTAQASYLPPQQVLQSTVHSTKHDAPKHPPGYSDHEGDVASVTSKDSFTSRNRMAKMESQIASLTAWVQTALTNSRPSSSASDRMSEVSYNSASNRSSMSGASSSTPQPGLSVELQKKISTSSEQVKELKTEFKQLKRIHEAQSESIQDTIKDALNKIQSAVDKIPGANHSPLRSKRYSLDVNLDAYKRDHTSVLKQIGELEACVAELRGDVVSKRCHVNITEVEALALKLSKATRSAADVKSKFPKLVKELQAVSQSEMDSVIQQQEFISREPEKIEDALRRCKAVTNVLFTLKRLAAVDSHRTVVIPKLNTLPVEESMKKQLLRDIERITPNHNDRMKSLESAERSLSRRKDILLSKDVLKFEKSLEIASKSLKDAEKLPKADIDTEKGVEKLFEQAKQYRPFPSGSVHTNSKPLSQSFTSGESDRVVTRTKSQQRHEHSLPFIQNRDSIHWDAESDSDSDDKLTNGGFIDVTEATTGLSAFTLVNKNNNAEAANSCLSNGSVHCNGGSMSPPQILNQERSPVNNHNKQSIPNGKIYQSPVVAADQPGTISHRRKDLQEQCQKLQELQRNHRLTPTRGPAKIVRPTSTDNNTSNFTTPPFSKMPNGHAKGHTNGTGKPLIAPKPQFRDSGTYPTPKTSRSFEQHCSSSTDSDNDSLTLKEPKSTTV